MKQNDLIRYPNPNSRFFSNGVKLCCHLRGLLFLSIIDLICVQAYVLVLLKIVGDVISSRAATCCTQRAECSSQSFLRFFSPPGCCLKGALKKHPVATAPLPTWSDLLASIFGASLSARITCVKQAACDEQECHLLFSNYDDFLRSWAGLALMKRWQRYIRAARSWWRQNDTATFISQGQFNDGTNCPAHLTPSIDRTVYTTVEVAAFIYMHAQIFTACRNVFIVGLTVYCRYVYFCIRPDIFREVFPCLYLDERRWWCHRQLETNRCSSSSETLRCEIKQEEKTRWSINKLRDLGVVVSARNGERRHRIFIEMEVCWKMRELWSHGPELGKDKEEGSTEGKQTEWKKKM